MLFSILAKTNSTQLFSNLILLFFFVSPYWFTTTSVHAFETKAQQKSLDPSKAEQNLKATTRPPISYEKILGFESEGMKLRLELIKKVKGIPWGFAFISEDEILHSLRSGDLKKLNLKTGDSVSVIGKPNSVEFGQGGMLDIALHPNFKTNQTVFVSYTVKVKDEYTTEVSRFHFDGMKLSDQKVIFKADPPTDNSVHFGSRLAVSSDDHIFISIGDRGERKLAQDLNAHAGKVIRLKTDGSIPTDNPFVGMKEHKPEVWTYGHRNPQGLFLNPNGELWLTEHGPRGGDEVNLIKKGLNYGWPLATYGREYYGPSIGEKTKPGIEEPIHHWTPSIAPSGLLIYNGDKLPGWKGNLISGALVLTHLNRLVFSEKRKVKKQDRHFTELGFRVRAVQQGPDQWIYFSTDDGRFFRIVTDD